MLFSPDLWYNTPLTHIHQPADMTEHYTKEEFDELSKIFSIKEDPDNLGVFPQGEHPEEYMKLFDKHKEEPKKKVP